MLEEAIAVVVSRIDAQPRRALSVGAQEMVQLAEQTRLAEPRRRLDQRQPGPRLPAQPLQQGRTIDQAPSARRRTQLSLVCRDQHIVSSPNGEPTIDD